MTINPSGPWTSISVADSTDDVEKKPHHHHHHHHHGDVKPRNYRLIPDNPQKIRMDRKHSRVDFALGDGMIVVTQGYGGYQEVVRPKDVAISDWPGTPNMKLDIPIMIQLTDWSGPHSGVRVPGVKNRIERIFKVGRGNPEDQRPPAFRLYGKAMPPRANGSVFALEGLDWGDTVISEGHWIRQNLVLHVMEYEREDNIKIKRRKRKHGGHGGGHHRKYHVKKGDTLFSIAKHFYGDWHKWHRLANKNHIKNPRKLHVGQVLIIP